MSKLSMGSTGEKGCATKLAQTERFGDGLTSSSGGSSPERSGVLCPQSIIKVFVTEIRFTHALVLSNMAHGSRDKIWRCCKPHMDALPVSISDI
jgi:hypothetical protein